MVDCLAPPPGGLEDDPQVLDQFSLTDELVQGTGPQARFFSLFSWVGGRTYDPFAGSGSPW
jgi:hypothetical protein